MREAFFILIVLLALVGLTAYRYRKQLMFALQIWRTLTGAREMQMKNIPTNESENQVKGELVNCSRCGKWTPQTTAIKFGATIYYCSTRCLQSKVKN